MFQRNRTTVTLLRSYTSSVSLRLPPSPQGEGFASLNDQLSSGTLWTTSVKSRIFAQRSCCSKKHGRRKSGENRKTGRKNLCKAAVHIHRGCGLWKTPVEKAVENVENYEFSTGIWLFQRRPGGCGKVCIPVCIKQVTNGLQKRYVTGAQPFTSFERSRKS